MAYTKKWPERWGGRKTGGPTLEGIEISPFMASNAQLQKRLWKTLDYCASFFSNVVEGALPVR